MNGCIVIAEGNLGEAPTLRFVPRKNPDSTNGSTEPFKVINFSICVTKSWYDQNTHTYVNEEETWLQCAFWGNQAEHYMKILKKGMPIHIEGTEENGTYDKDGTDVPFRQIRVSKIYIVPNRRIEQIILAPKKNIAGVEQLDKG